MTQDDAMCVKAASAELAYNRGPNKSGCLGSYPTPVENVTFVGNTVLTSCGGAKFGMQAEAPMRAVSFVDHVVVHARRGVVVEATEGTATMEDLLFQNVHIETVTGTVSETGAEFPPEPIAISTKFAPVRNVTLDNVAFAVAAKAMDGVSKVEGFWTVADVEDVRF